MLTLEDGVEAHHFVAVHHDLPGAELMSRIAAPMVGGMISSTVLTLAVTPALYALVKEWRLHRSLKGGQIFRAQPDL